LKKNNYSLYEFLIFNSKMQSLKMFVSIQGLPHLQQLQLIPRKEENIQQIVFVLKDLHRNIVKYQCTSMVWSTIVETFMEIFGEFIKNKRIIFEIKRIYNINISSSLLKFYKLL